MGPVTFSLVILSVDAVLVSDTAWSDLMHVLVETQHRAPGRQRLLSGGGDTQRRCAEAGCRGTPREWCDLMSRLARGSDLPEHAHEVVLTVLEHRTGLRGAADGRLGRKAGDLPGALAFAGYVRDRGGGAADVAVALFLRDLTGELLPRLAQALPQGPAHLLELRSALPVHR